MTSKNRRFNRLLQPASVKVGSMCHSQLRRSLRQHRIMTNILTSTRQARQGVRHVSVLCVRAQESLPNTQGPTSAANLDIAPAHWHVGGGTLHTQAFVARIELIILSISRVKAVDYQFQFLESMQSSQLGSPSGDWGQSAKEVPGHRACAAHLA